VDTVLVVPVLSVVLVLLVAPSSVMPLSATLLFVTGPAFVASGK
jgi:hypothetical protein